MTEAELRAALAAARVTYEAERLRIVMPFAGVQAERAAETNRICAVEVSLLAARLENEWLCRDLKCRIDKALAPARETLRARETALRAAYFAQFRRVGETA